MSAILFEIQCVKQFTLFVTSFTFQYHITVYLLYSYLTGVKWSHVYLIYAETEVPGCLFGVGTEPFPSNQNVKYECPLCFPNIPFLPVV